METDWKIGNRIWGRFQIYQVLHGGMGTIYVVYDHERREPCVIKTLQDELFNADPRFAENFVAEAHVWINLDSHRNITRAINVAYSHTRPTRLLLFLEFVSGGDLSRWIGTPRLTGNLRQSLIFGLQFADGMIHAQSRGLRAHRDVKPSNCLLTNDGTLKITDFGLSKLGIVSNSGVTRISLSAPTNVERGSVFDGTPEYMAPEQFLGSHADVRSDIYSFGVMFFEMLRGTRPFVATSPEELAALHLHKNPPRLKNRNRQVDELVAECLAKNPNDRPQDFTMVRERLSELYEQVAATPAPTRVTGIPFNVRDDRQGR